MTFPAATPRRPGPTSSAITGNSAACGSHQQPSQGSKRATGHGSTCAAACFPSRSARRHAERLRAPFAAAITRCPGVLGFLWHWPTSRWVGVPFSNAARPWVTFSGLTKCAFRCIMRLSSNLELEPDAEARTGATTAHIRHQPPPSDALPNLLSQRTRTRRPHRFGQRNSQPANVVCFQKLRGWRP